MDPADLNTFRKELATRMATLAAATGDHLSLLAALNRECRAVVDDYRQRAGGKWNDGEFEISQDIVRQALVVAEGVAIAAAQTDEALRTSLRDYFLLKGVERYAQGSIRYDQIARLGDAESVEMVFQAASESLPDTDYQFNASPIYGLVHLVQREPYSERAREFIRGSFDATIEACAGELVSNNTFEALARAISALADPSLNSILYKAFAFAADEEQHFELNLSAAEMAVRLAALNYEGPLEAFETFCAWLNYTYKGESFTLKALYALWLLTRDDKAALSYLEDPNNDRSLGLAATACADLHCTAAIPVLQRRLGELTNSVTRETFVEALNRLQEQDAPPHVEERMIWMHGLVTREQLLQGVDTIDVYDVFAIRASIATSEPVGRVFEVDDSAKPDI